MSRFRLPNMDYDEMPPEDMEVSDDWDDADLWLSRLAPDFN
jgi:hypothetical protein